MSDSWISAETELKENDFRGLLGMHINICKSILARRRSRYLYVDLYAGPGHLEYKGRRFDGSPLIARDLLTRTGVPYEAIHFEKDPDVAARLAEALYVPVSLVDTPCPETSPIYVEDFRDGFARWLDQRGRQPDQYGLVYSDPIKDPIPYELLTRAAELMPRVDLLSYVSATQYKRRRGQDLKRNGHSDLPLIGDHIAAVNKKVALIRRPYGAWQWTFVLWTNWEGMPQWEQHGFYRINSPAGQRILDTLNLTRREQFERANVPLWSDSDAA